MPRKIYGLCGFIGAGKTTTANILVKNHNFKAISFAGVLKDVVSVLFGWSRDMLEGDTERSREEREKVDVWWSKTLGKEIVPRYMLQYIGTEVFRNNFHPEIWVHCAMKRVLSDIESNFVFTDARFGNEIKAITAIGGEMIWVQRDVLPPWFDTAKYSPEKMTYSYPNIHRSEWEWVSNGPFLKLNNHGNLESLEDKISELIGEKVRKNLI